MRDYANYSFPQFAAHRDKPLRDYFGLYRRLGTLGLSRHLSFHAWFLGILLLGARNAQHLVSSVRGAVGHTPNLTRMVRRKYVR